MPRNPGKTDRQPKANNHRPTAKTNAARASHPGRIVRQNVQCLVPHTWHGERMTRHRSEENDGDIHSAECHSRSELRKINLQHCGGRRPILPCVEDSLRRPQRPGNQCAETRSGGTLPIIHPRELPGTASSAAMLWQGNRTSRLNVTHSALPRAQLQEKSHPAL
jgi:hypothetical protein